MSGTSGSMAEKGVPGVSCDSGVDTAGEVAASDGVFAEGCALDDMRVRLRVAGPDADTGGGDSARWRFLLDGEPFRAASRSDSVRANRSLRDAFSRRRASFSSFSRFEIF